MKYKKGKSGGDKEKIQQNETVRKGEDKDRRRKKKKDKRKRREWANISKGILRFLKRSNSSKYQTPALRNAT
jgi:hypothetical protein